MSSGWRKEVRPRCHLRRKLLPFYRHNADWLVVFASASVLDLRRVRRDSLDILNDRVCSSLGFTPPNINLTSRVHVNLSGTGQPTERNVKTSTSRS